MNESERTTRLLKDLNKIPGTHWEKVHTGGPFAAVGRPDILGVYKGRLVWIEVKVGKNPVTPAQHRSLSLWAKHGALSLVLVFAQPTQPVLLEHDAYIYNVQSPTIRHYMRGPQYTMQMDGFLMEELDEG